MYYIGGVMYCGGELERQKEGKAVDEEEDLAAWVVMKNACAMYACDDSDLRLAWRIVPLRENERAKGWNAVVGKRWTPAHKP
ncbi:hypothetical protein CBOM_07461 [Ceraceosorus bombacis]|uniref:Uncharacterized protein n=1 Tax=Ceraceosorus bombacis TaxID=401625 RepID=A0A0P1BCX1_9BASI|nr:hypothetical protein CBOM_07461 [Ceraceosorus bombacis]